MPSFNELVTQRRKDLGLSQKELAARILKEDGSPISPQYLNDLENDRRGAPSDHIMAELARVLGIDIDVLFFAAGELSPSLRQHKDLPEKNIGQAIQAFRKKLQNG